MVLAGVLGCWWVLLQPVGSISDQARLFLTQLWLLEQSLLMTCSAERSTPRSFCLHLQGIASLSAPSTSGIVAGLSGEADDFEALSQECSKEGSGLSLNKASLYSNRHFR